MKKLYTLALCAAVAFSAAAQLSLSKATMSALPQNAIMATPKIVKNTEHADLMSPTATAAKKAPAKLHESDKWESLGTGKYTDFILSSLWKIDPFTLEVEIEKSTTTDGLYRIVELYKNYTLDESLVNAGVSYDAAKAQPFYFAVEGDAFVFEGFNVGFTDDEGDYSVTTKVEGLYPQYTVSMIASVYPDAVGVYNNGILTYPYSMSVEGTTYTNILLGCGDTSEGYYRGNTSNQFKIVMPGVTENPVDPNEGWTSVGNATFIDPWAVPGAGANQYDYSYEVELQQKDADKNTFRLVNPYGANSPVGNINQHATKSGYIQFNIADPEHVTFEPVEAGFAHSGLGIQKFYCYNTLSYFALYYEMDAAAVVEVLGDLIPYTTFKDGVVLIGSNETTDDNGNPTVQYDACFGIQGDILGGYNWTDQNDNPKDMSGSIVFPANWKEFVEQDGVGNIAVDNTNAPVEYFNLQGQRIANPAAGQLLIRRQGSETSKVLVK